VFQGHSVHSLFQGQVVNSLPLNVPQNTCHVDTVGTQLWDCKECEPDLTKLRFPYAPSGSLVAELSRGPYQRKLSYFTRGFVQVIFIVMRGGFFQVYFDTL
jgi:hypothetical protein